MQKNPASSVLIEPCSEDQNNDINIDKEVEADEDIEKCIDADENLEEKDVAQCTSGDYDVEKIVFLVRRSTRSTEKFLPSE